MIQHWRIYCLTWRARVWEWSVLLLWQWGSLPRLDHQSGTLHHLKSRFFFPPFFVNSSICSLVLIIWVINFYPLSSLWFTCQAACQAAAAYCKEKGKSISKIALQYSLSNKDISTILVGMMSVGQVILLILPWPLHFDSWKKFETLSNFSASWLKKA